MLGLVAYLFETLALVVLAQALDAPLPFGAAGLAIALSNLAGMLSLNPGGFGVAEGGLVVALSFQGTPLTITTALTLLFRALTLWFGLALGAASAGALHWLHGHRKAERGVPPPA